ncbi:MAG: hypothetical protein QOJ15_7921 [Bradyrhizobium sp.]|jgi:hypothetical protein|nr:hypothetical protein [Bradyrhizobium sp.]
MDYRAYFVGGDGHFVRFVGLSCSDDAEAIEQARRLIGGQDIELWSGERFIMRLPKKQDRPDRNPDNRRQGRVRRRRDPAGGIGCA